jgi:Fur family ferric uptake transcriptional regulator
MAPRPEKKDEQALRDAIRAAGLRATPSRIAVLRLLRTTTSPISHADVVQRVGEHVADRATLYRNLLDFVSHGLARRTDVGDHMWRFELLGAERDETAHPHFVCNECGRVECLPDVTVSMPKGVRGPRAVRAHQVQVQMKGICDHCD